jgi:hypothetical protein
MGNGKTQASDREEQETGKWGKARDRQVMGESERQASDGEDQETGKWRRRARDR